MWLEVSGRSGVRPAGPGREDRQAGADQGDELLIEDQELFEVELLPLGRRPEARPLISERGLME